MYTPLLLRDGFHADMVQIRRNFESSPDPLLMYGLKLYIGLLVWFVLVLMPLLGVLLLRSGTTNKHVLHDAHTHAQPAFLEASFQEQEGLT